MKRYVKFAVMWILILSAIILYAWLFINSIKILRTAMRLSEVQNVIDYIERQEEKDEGMNIIYKQNLEKKKEIYNSNDFVIKWFLEKNIISKIIIAIMAIITITGTFFMFLVIIVILLKIKR